MFIQRFFVQRFFVQRFFVQRFFVQRYCLLVFAVVALLVFPLSAYANGDGGVSDDPDPVGLNPPVTNPPPGSGVEHDNGDGGTSNICDFIPNPEDYAECAARDDEKARAGVLMGMITGEEAAEIAYVTHGLRCGFLSEVCAVFDCGDPVEISLDPNFGKHGSVGVIENFDPIGLATDSMMNLHLDQVQDIMVGHFKMICHL